MTVTGGSRPRGQTSPEGRFTSWLRKVFALDRAGLDWPLGVAFIDLAVVVLVVFLSIGYEQYLLSALFGLLFAMLADPGGGFAYRAGHVAIFALAGAGLTALGFALGSAAWGWLVLAVFVVSAAAGLAVVFGVRRLVAAILLNVWFVVALGLAFSFGHHTRVDSHIWAQTLAWAGGSALWIVVAYVVWLVRGRRDWDRPVAELPGDAAHRDLTRPIVLFALIRALALAGTAALAFGLDLPHGYWLLIAALVALKPSLEQATLVGSQRVIGALIGAVTAALLLLIPTSEHGLKLLASIHALEIVALVILMHGAAIRFWNYAIYTGAIAAGVLILMDLPQPSDYAAEGYRLLWTVCGVGIGVVVLLIAGLLAKRAAPASKPPAAKSQASKATRTTKATKPRGVT